MKLVALSDGGRELGAMEYAQCVGQRVGKDKINNSVASATPHNPAGHHQSSNEGDTVLDPFCGCGTTVHVRGITRPVKWISIDISKFSSLIVFCRYLNVDDIDMRHLWWKRAAWRGKRI